MSGGEGGGETLGAENRKERLQRGPGGQTEGGGEEVEGKRRPQRKAEELGGKRGEQKRGESEKVKQMLIAKLVKGARVAIR